MSLRFRSCIIGSLKKYIHIHISILLKREGEVIKLAIYIHTRKKGRKKYHFFFGGIEVQSHETQ